MYQVNRKKLEQWLSPRAESLLCTLVNQSSYTRDLEGVQAVQRILAERLREIGFSVRLHSVKARADVLVADSAESVGSAPLLLVGHADTVHPKKEGWGARIEGDVCHGPGSYDMKSGVITALLALEYLYEEKHLLRFPIRVLINSAEEDGTDEIAALIGDLALGARGALVFESGRKGGDLVVERKGIVTYSLVVHGRAAHTGNSFHEGRSAIGALARLIPSLEQFSSSERGISCNVGTISGGTALNVVAERAEIKFEIRSPFQEDLLSVHSKLEQMLGALGEGIRADLHREQMIPPMEKSEAALSLAARYQEAGHAIGVSFGLLDRVGGLSDANLIAAQGVPTIDALGPQGGGAHTGDEWVSLSSLRERIALLVQFLGSCADQKVGSPQEIVAGR